MLFLKFLHFLSLLLNLHLNLDSWLNDSLILKTFLTWVFGIIKINLESFASTLYPAQTSKFDTPECLLCKLMLLHNPLQISIFHILLANPSPPLSQTYNRQYNHDEAKPWLWPLFSPHGHEIQHLLSQGPHHCSLHYPFNLYTLLHSNFHHSLQIQRQHTCGVSGEVVKLEHEVEALVPDEVRHVNSTCVVRLNLEKWWKLVWRIVCRLKR